MARTKNREYQQVLSPAYTFSRRWKMGGYIRLSKEDLKKALNGKDDSNSVKNQRDLLNDFYRKYQEEFESITEYVDDGHTGTDSDREAFQQLLADVMSRKIDCVVVKDLSRFARNYSDAGQPVCADGCPIYQPRGKRRQLQGPGQRFQYHRSHYQRNERSILLSDLKEDPAGV